MMPQTGHQTQTSSFGSREPTDPGTTRPSVLHSSVRLLTRAEVEAQYGIPKRFLETAVARGDGPPLVRVGRLVRYKTSDIQRWIDSVREAPSSVA